VVIGALGGEYKYRISIRDCYDQLFAEEALEFLDKIRRQDSSCHEGAIRLQDRIFNGLVARANKSGGDLLVRAVGARFCEKLIQTQMNLFVFGPGKINRLAVLQVAWSEDCALRPRNGKINGRTQELRFDQQMPALFIREGACGSGLGRAAGLGRNLGRQRAVRPREHGQGQEQKPPVAERAVEVRNLSVTCCPHMITFLDGTLVEALPTLIVVAVHGVGYQVQIPLSSFDKLPATGQSVKILTHLQVREDAHVLYGFMTAAERDLFRLLINHVSGIGPKTALDVLSGTSITAFKAAVVSSDVASLARTKGIGKKTAERIIVELKDKVGVAAAWEAASSAHAPSGQDLQINDAVLALISLGYKQADAHKAVKQALLNAAGNADSEELVRQGLKLLI